MSTPAEPNPFDVEADLDGTVRAATSEEPESPEPPEEEEGTEPAAEGAPPRPRRGRRPKAAAQGPAIPPPNVDPSTTYAHIRAADEFSDDPKDWPEDGFVMWLCCVRWGQKRGLQPGDWSIGIRRQLIGMYPGEEVRFASIPGARVQAYGPYSAADMLQRYLIETCHSVSPSGAAPSPGSAGCPAARYTLEFYCLRNKSQALRHGKVELASYAELKRQQEQGDSFAAQIAASVPVDGGGVAAGTPQIPTLPRAHPVAAGPVAGAPGAAGAPAMGTTDWALHQEIGYLRAVRDESEKAMREGRAPQPILGHGAAAPSPAEEEARIQRVVTAALTAAGVKPKTDEERMAAMMQQVIEATTKNLIALYGPPPGQQPASPTQSAATAETTVSAIKRLLEEFKTMREAESTFKKELGFKEEEAEVIQPQQVVLEEREKSIGEKVAGFMRSIPPGTLPQVIAGLGAVLDGSPAGEMLKKVLAGVQSAGAVAAAMPQKGNPWGGPAVG